MAKSDSVGKHSFSSPRIACVDSGSERARISRDELAGLYELVAPEESDVIVALGGDGFVLHVVHQYLHLRRPIFGMNCGTVGFLLNVYRPDTLIERIRAAQEVTLHPLRMTAKTMDGKIEESLAFNEVSVLRRTRQQANVRISVDGIVRISACGRRSHGGNTHRQYSLQPFSTRTRHSSREQSARSYSGQPFPAATLEGSFAIAHIGHRV